MVSTNISYIIRDLCFPPPLKYNGDVIFSILVSNILSRSSLIARFLIWVTRQMTLLQQSCLIFRWKWVCVSCCSLCHFTHLHIFSSVLGCPLRFPCSNDARVVFTLICFVGFIFHSCLCLFVVIHVYWCPTRFQYQMMLL